MRQRIQHIGSDRDVAAASRAGMALGRGAGLSVGSQLRLAALLTELGRELLRRSESATCELRDESDQDGPRLRLLLRGSGSGLRDAARQLVCRDGALPRWLGRWPLRRVSLSRDGEGHCLTVAIGGREPAAPELRSTDS